MMEAQRFPWDFDGIIGGSPSLSVTGIHMNLLWANRALVAKTDELRMLEANLEILHKAVLAKCDMNDGVKDGLIGDPRACTFDPAQLLCTAGKRSECLTPTQLEVVNKIYSGPVTSTGEQIYMTSAMKGSELSWLNWFRGPPGNPQAIYDFVREEFRYSAFQPNPVSVPLLLRFSLRPRNNLTWPVAFPRHRSILRRTRACRQPPRICAGRG
jgi:Tannase and feruloyl esterase